MATGKVKFYSVDKGYGFIRPDDESAVGDIFFHKSNAIDAVDDGDRVEFGVRTNTKNQKLEAHDVKLAA